MTKKDRNALAIEVKKTLRHMKLVLAPLEADLNLCGKALESGKDPQFWRRLNVRTACGLIEATVYQLKQIILRVAPLSAIPLTPKETELVTETRFVKHSGQAIPRPKFIPLTENLTATFRVFARVHAIECPLDTTGIGFTDFAFLVEVRNRLTHPKKPFDVEVNDAALDRCVCGSDWAYESYARLMDASSANLDHVSRLFQNGNRRLID